MKEKVYKLLLFRYRRSTGYREEFVEADFRPAKVNGFGVLLNKIKKIVK